MTASWDGDPWVCGQGQEAPCPELSKLWFVICAASVMLPYFLNSPIHIFIFFYLPSISSFFLPLRGPGRSPSICSHFALDVWCDAHRSLHSDQSLPCPSLPLCICLPPSLPLNESLLQVPLAWPPLPLLHPLGWLLPRALVVLFSPSISPTVSICYPMERAWELLKERTILVIFLSLRPRAYMFDKRVND